MAKMLHPKLFIVVSSCEIRSNSRLGSAIFLNMLVQHPGTRAAPGRHLDLVLVQLTSNDVQGGLAQVEAPGMACHVMSKKDYGSQENSDSP